jgi:hypothetical protein
MLISSNNSSNVITAPRFEENEVLLMTADADGRWLMVDDGARGGSEMEVRRRRSTTLNTN